MNTKKDNFKAFSIRESFNLISDKKIEITYYDKLVSTHTIAKELVESNTSEIFNKPPKIIIANEQENGYGRFGKYFYSPIGKGIYMTIILPNFAISANFVTMYAATAICNAIENTTGKSPSVKWVNDIFIKNKKVCGILSNNIVSKEGNVILLGIGINFYENIKNIPKELHDIITYIFTDENPITTRSDLTAQIINNILSLTNCSNKSIVQQYKNLLFILGKKINVYKNNNIIYQAKAIDLDENGYLIVEDENGKKIKLVSGEVSIAL